MSVLNEIDQVGKELIEVFNSKDKDIDATYEEIQKNPVFKDIRKFSKNMIKAYLIFAGQYRNINDKKKNKKKDEATADAEENVRDIIKLLRKVFDSARDPEMTEDMRVTYFRMINMLLGLLEMYFLDEIPSKKEKNKDKDEKDDDFPIVGQYDEDVIF